MNSDPTTVINPHRSALHMRHRLARLIALVAMLGSALTLAGGALVASAGSAAASKRGADPSCTTLTGTVDLSQQVAVLTGTLSGCQSNGDGAITAVFNLNGTPGPGSIFWAKLDASSGITLSVAASSQTGACPATASVTITVGGGPSAGTSGTGFVCEDFTNYPVVAVSNSGPITL